MLEIIREGGLHVVRHDGQDIAWFIASLDANRFAIAMLRDGLASSVRLVNCGQIEP